MAQCAYCLPSNFDEQLKTTACRKELLAQVPASLQRQRWAPKMVSVKNRPLKAGIAFRDTRSKKAYQIWSDGGKIFFLEFDLKAKDEVLKTWVKHNDCAVTTEKRSSAKLQMPNTVGFTDADLDALMNAHDWGVIYIWTPYMPLSVEAIQEIKAAVKANGGHLTILLDGKAKVGDAKEWVKKGMALDSELVQVASEELYSREIGTHYPVAIMYKNKFLSNSDYVGHKKNEIYQKWITLELADLNKDLK